MDNTESSAISLPQAVSRSSKPSLPFLSYNKRALVSGNSPTEMTSRVAQLIHILNVMDLQVLTPQDLTAVSRRVANRKHISISEWTRRLNPLKLKRDLQYSCKQDMYTFHGYTVITELVVVISRVAI